MKIEDICTRICSGGTPKSGKAEYYENGTIPWLNTKEINFNRIQATEAFITEEGLNNSSAKWIKPHTVIVAMYGATAGRVAVAEIPLTTNQACCNLEVDETIADYRYIYYWLKQNFDNIAGLANGGAQQNLSAKVIRQIEINLPDLIKQRSIANFLDSFDSKIEANAKLNGYLLELAMARFESALETESKAIRLGDVVALEDSKRIPLNSRDREARKGPYPYYGATSVMDHVDDYLFDGVRVLLGEDGTVIDSEGKPILQYVWGKYWVNNHAHILAPSAGYSLEAIYIALSRTTINHIVTGAVQMKISQRNLKSLEIEMPSPESLDYLQDLFAVYRSNQDESAKLASLRDVLLPKLMSGEIDVSKVDLTQLNSHLA